MFGGISKCNYQIQTHLFKTQTVLYCKKVVWDTFAAGNQRNEIAGSTEYDLQHFYQPEFSSAFTTKRN